MHIRGTAQTFSWRDTANGGRLFYSEAEEYSIWLQGGGSRTLEKHEELRDLYSAPNVIKIKLRRMIGSRHAARMSEMRNEYRIFVRKHERKGPIEETKV
jgi:hypothetical protein